MEGAWRVFAAGVATLVSGLSVLSGCGGEPSSAPPEAVRTDNPERTFAPLVELDANERWRPMSARWFIERSVFRFAEDQGCQDRDIAVGRTMPEQQNEVIDWIYPKGLGRGPNYYRNPYDDRCERNSAVSVDADELTRPHDPGPRVEGLRPGEGYYLDLSDAARGGPNTLGRTPVYVERRDEGDSRARLTYWMLFGMDAPPPDPAGAREGDWERVDVLLDVHGDDRYEARAVQLGAGAATASSHRDIPWNAVRHVGGTHPVVAVASGSHVVSARTEGAPCRACVSWRAWEVLSDARSQLWYGFGGAWGEVGDTDSTSGPLGPHDRWPKHVR